MGPRPIGSFAASSATLGCYCCCRSVCSVQYKSIESFQVAPLMATLPLGLFIPLYLFVCSQRGCNDVTSCYAQHPPPRQHPSPSPGQHPHPKTAPTLDSAPPLTGQHPPNALDSTHPRQHPSSLTARTPPPGQHPLVNKLAVGILLECFLVYFVVINLQK